ncbi:MAG: hypothetical protein J7L74_01795 [Candidatus Hydrothermae bacterium]|nr:hypothetical protein [Candidatus Hydrothermae bacterium]
MKKFLPIVALLILTFLSCTEPPRDNPLDPLSPEYRGCVFRGRVLRLYNNAPIEGILVQTDSRFCFTDGNGSFTFDRLLPGGHNFIFDGEGYMPETLVVTLKSDLDTTLRLDALPLFEEASLYTIHVRSPSQGGDRYELGLRAKVTDPDGMPDVSGVRAIFNSETLSLRFSDGIYGFIMTDDMFPGGDIRALEGVPFRFEAIDQQGALSRSRDLYILRIVEDAPWPISPANGDSVEYPVILLWDSGELPFPYHFRIEVYRIIPGMPEMRVFVVDSIPADQQELRLTVHFVPGYYFWTVWYVDEFGNMSRSKEALFHVTEQ